LQDFLKFLTSLSEIKRSSVTQDEIKQSKNKKIEKGAKISEEF
jgi:hypothetical protein